MQSAEIHSEVISGFLASEFAAGRVFGPVGPDVAPLVQVNRFGQVPKGYQPGKWRLIVDLSFPRGYSINDSIEPSVCRLHYTSVDEACKRIVAGAILAKFDVEGAFHTVPQMTGNFSVWVGKDRSMSTRSSLLGSGLHQSCIMQLRNPGEI